MQLHVANTRRNTCAYISMSIYMNLTHWHIFQWRPCGTVGWHSIMFLIDPHEGTVSLLLVAQDTMWLPLAKHTERMLLASACDQGTVSTLNWKEKVTHCYFNKHVSYNVIERALHIAEDIYIYVHTLSVPCSHVRDSCACSCRCLPAA